MRYIEQMRLMRLPEDVRTESLYIPKRKGVALADRPDEELARGLCLKSRGRLEACKKCAGKCTFGRILLERARMREEAQGGEPNEERANDAG